MEWLVSDQIAVSTRTGSLIGKVLPFQSIEEGYTAYTLGGRGTTEEWRAVFFQENRRFYLHNDTQSEEETVSVSFSADRANGGQTFLIPAGWICDITDELVKRACMNDSHICVMGMRKMKAEDERERFFLTEGRRKNISVGEDCFYPLCRYYSVKLETQAVIIRPERGTELAGIPHISLISSGDSQIALSGLPGTAARGDIRREELHFALPCGGKRGTLYDIVVLAVIHTREDP